MSASVICISHADGAGGREIGQLLADQIGFRYVDDGIIATAAQEKGLFAEAVSLAESRGSGRQLEVDFNRFEKTETLRGLIRDAIVATADEGKVVIVSHAASYALTGRETVLRVLVTASPDTRARRIAEADGIGDSAAAKQLKESDKGRATYLKKFYGVDRELPTDYDLLVNSDRLTFASAADAIAHAAA